MSTEEKPKRCPKARQAKGGRCERVGCGHVAGVNVRVCQCCVAQLGKTAMDRIVLLRRNASVEDVRRVEDEYLAQLNAMPARRRVWRAYPKTEVA